MRVKVYPLKRRPSPGAENRQITLRHFDGCPNRRIAEGRLRAALEDAGSPDAAISIEQGATHEEAIRPGFRGSPTVLIDGRDPSADERAAHLFASAHAKREEYVLKHLEEGWSLDDALGLYRTEVKDDSLLTIWGAAGTTMAAAPVPLSRSRPIEAAAQSRPRTVETRPNPISSAHVLQRELTADNHWNPANTGRPVGERTSGQSVKNPPDYTATSRTADPGHVIPVQVERAVVSTGRRSTP